MDVPSTVFLTRQELAERLKIKPRTLANWSANGRGPQCCVIGSRVLYRLDDVVVWEQEQLVDDRNSVEACGLPEGRCGSTAFGREDVKDYE